MSYVVSAIQEAIIEYDLEGIIPEELQLTVESRTNVIVPQLAWVIVYNTIIHPGSISNTTESPVCEILVRGDCESARGPNMSSVSGTSIQQQKCSTRHQSGHNSRTCHVPHVDIGY